MIDIDHTEPMAPVLFRVKVPPETSSGVSFLFLARSVRSAMAWARPPRLSRSAFLMLGTISPSPAATARPRFIFFLRMMVSPPHSLLTSG